MSASHRNTPGGARQTCPRRMREHGWWDHREGLDVWCTDRWAATQEEADARVADMLARSPNIASVGNMVWVYSETRPRTCSFCGSIHPDDAVTLLREGWRVRVTHRPDMRYLEPPTDRPPLSPPVQLYVVHFSDEQVFTFDQVMDEKDNDEYFK